MSKVKSSPQSNHLLSLLKKADFALLKPDLEPFALEIRGKLEQPNKSIKHVYFVERGVVSVVSVSGANYSEIGLIGREGMTGISVVLGNDRSPHQAYVQIVGQAQRIKADLLRAAMEQSPRLRNCFLHFVQAFMVQTAHTAVANGRARIDERLARWLLMAHDRVDGNEIELTHDFIALMLSVRRAGVTEAIHKLERSRHVRTKRGGVVILDRPGLKTIADGFYGLPEAEYRRLTGWRQHK